MRTFFVKCLLFLPLFVLAGGCGKGSVGTLSGKVSYKGQPLTGGTVFFFPEKSKTGNFAAPIKEDGSYKITNLPLGLAKVSIETGGAGGPPPEVLKSMGPMGSRMAAKAMEEKKKMMKDTGRPDVGASAASVSLPEKYADPEKSGISVNVTGGKQTFDISLE
jgi:hypothetical protein